MRIPIAGIQADFGAEALVVYSQQQLITLATSLVGGGFTQTRYIINRHVHKDYHHPNPARDLRDYARRRGIQGTFVGMMTAASTEKARMSFFSEGELSVCAIVTAGLSNAYAAGITPLAKTGLGTINTILLIDGKLLPATLANAIITVTEAKCDVLRQLDRRTASGEIATGTSTDAVVVSSTGRGAPISYSGPATLVGWLSARAVRQSLEEALE